MPKGPKGQKRPADVIGAAVKMMQIATDEIEEATDNGKNKAAQEIGRKGGKARAEKMSRKHRTKIARTAAAKGGKRAVDKSLNNSDYVASRSKQRESLNANRSRQGFR